MIINLVKELNRLRFILMRGKSIRDSIALGAVGGLLGTLAMVLSNFLIFKAEKTEILYGHLAGSIFMRPFRTNQTKNFILGQIFHLVNGSGIGLLMVQVFKRFGTDLALLKGSMLGMFTWQALYTAGQRLGIYTAKPRLTKTGYSALWNNFVYGTVTAYSIKWLAHPSVFPSIEQTTEYPENIESIQNKDFHEPLFKEFEKPPQFH